MEWVWELEALLSCHILFGFHDILVDEFSWICYRVRQQFGEKNIQPNMTDS